MRSKCYISSYFTFKVYSGELIQSQRCTNLRRLVICTLLGLLSSISNNRVIAGHNHGNLLK